MCVCVHMGSPQKTLLQMGTARSPLLSSLLKIPLSQGEDWKHLQWTLTEEPQKQV